MADIILRKWEDLDIRLLAEMTCEIRRYEGLGDYSVDQVEEYLRNLHERFPIEIALLAIDEDKILGWIGIERVTEQIGEIGRWQPFVTQETDRNNVAKQLISKINSYAQENGMSRMEIGFGEIDENNLGTYEQRQSWYDSEGWNKLEDSYFMVVNKMDCVVQEPRLPEGFNLRHLIDVNNDTLYSCYQESFTTGQATWIYDMTEEQRRQEFEKNFNRSQQINESASFVVEKDGEIVGFALVIIRSDEEEHLESIGVHPSVRGKGLGKLMLWRVMQVLRSQDANGLSLGVDPVNIPAVKLYEKFGFELVSRTARYSWKVED